MTASHIEKERLSIGGVVGMQRRTTDQFDYDLTAFGLISKDDEGRLVDKGHKAGACYIIGLGLHNWARYPIKLS